MCQNISTQKVHELHTDYRNTDIKYISHVLFTLIYSMFASKYYVNFFTLSSDKFLRPLHQWISVSVYPCSPPCPAMRYLLCWCWDVADWVLPNAALCHSAKWSSGHLWSAQPNCAQTTPDIETQPHTTQTRAHTFT